MLPLLRAISAPFHDDRGVPIRIVEPLWLDDEVEQDGFEWAAPEAAGPLLLTGLLAGALVILAIVLVQSVGLPSWVASIVPFLVGPLAFAPLGRWLSASRALNPLTHASIHRIVRSGRCAACGYQLDGLEPDAEGLLHCPECDAAWSIARLHVRYAPGDAARRRGVRRALRRVMRLLPPAPRLDHRGRATSLGMYRCRGSLASDYGWRCVQAAAALRAGASVARTLCSLALAGLGFGLFGFLLWYGSSYQAPPWMVWLLPVMAILLLAAFLAKDSEIGLGPESVQTETLSRGLCPCCWELIAGIPPDADGFTMCPECGSAWRLPEPAPDRAPPMTCRACGYDLHGLDPDDRGVVTCPECGDVWIR